MHAEAGGMTQTAAILDLLLEQGDAGVTPGLAQMEIGTMRLAARIKELRDAGHDIVNVGWTTPSGKHVARYVLRSPVQPALWVSS